jgi:hypothetical protein
MALEKVPLSEVRLGPVRHESLNDELSARARAIYAIIGKHIGPYETFELNFCRDVNPGSEIQIWEMIAAAYLRYGELFGPLDDATEEHAFNSLIVLSMRGDKPAYVSQQVWKNVLSMFPPRPNQ